MPKFPRPPAVAELRLVDAARHTLRSGTVLARIYARGGRNPITWRGFRFDGPLAGARFDHHAAGCHRGVLYAACGLVTCVAEVFQGSRLVDPVADDRCLAAFGVIQDVELLDLTGDWPTCAGASQALASGSRPRAQAWARVIYEAYPDLQGIWYPSSMHGGHHAVVLFERAEIALPPRPDLDVPLAHPGLLPDLIRAAGTLGYLLG